MVLMRKEFKFYPTELISIFKIVEEKYTDKKTHQIITITITILLLSEFAVLRIKGLRNCYDCKINKTGIFRLLCIS
jgi:hypothetical protein